MEKETLNRLLNTACEIISALEGYADESLKKEIDVFFDEIVYSDKVDDEIKLLSADEEAQDYNTFGNYKI